MGREVKRVPLDFSWPVNKVWKGYLTPQDLQETPCGECDGNGLSWYANEWYEKWYGNAAFSPEETGSRPLTHATYKVWDHAERNVPSKNPASVLIEANRLAALWNGMWMHHLAQSDVDALIAADRLQEYTHEWVRGEGLMPKNPAPPLTAAEINEWSLTAFNTSEFLGALLQHRCSEISLSDVCPKCDGHGSVEGFNGQRELAEAWVATGPPAGEGWQLWSTTDEGSPMTPVFSSAEDLAKFCAAEGVSVFGRDTASYETWLQIILGEDFAHVEIAPGVVMM